MKPIVFFSLQAVLAQTGTYRIALPDYPGQLSWIAAGYNIVETSAKPQGTEIGLRGRNAEGTTFLGFLFRMPELAPMTAVACREKMLAVDGERSKSMKIRDRGESATGAWVTYHNGTNYCLRAFVATGETCGDLEFYGNKPLEPGDPELKKTLDSFRFDATYQPKFLDASLFAQVLYQRRLYKAAGPMFEKALALVPSDGAPFPSAVIARRVMRDQAGMSYGISGDTANARRVFQAGIAEDPDYPLYYYNMACAAAEEKKLDEAQTYLQRAFERKANVNPGERMPRPSTDDSFLPYKGDRKFWSFVERLEKN